MDKYFSLTVSVGSIIHQTSKPSVVIEGLPENAKEEWENGSSLIVLKSVDEDFLKGYTKKCLQEILEIRKSLGYEKEISILEKAIKKAAKE